MVCTQPLSLYQKTQNLGKNLGKYSQHRCLTRTLGTNLRKGSFINHEYMAGERGVCQIYVHTYYYIHKLYLVKYSTKGGGRGGQKSTKNCPYVLWTAPKNFQLIVIESRSFSRYHEIIKEFTNSNMTN